MKVKKGQKIKLPGSVKVYREGDEIDDKLLPKEKKTIAPNLNKGGDNK
jgi:hypothetical protein